MPSVKIRFAKPSQLWRVQSWFFKQWAYATPQTGRVFGVRIFGISLNFKQR